MKMKKWGAALASVMLVGTLGLFGCASSEPASETTTDAPETTTEATQDADDTEATAEDTEAADGELMLVEPGTLTIAASLDFPPFENLSGTEAEGFEVDLVNAIAEQLGLETNWVNSKFDTIVPQIQTGGKSDLGVSGITISDERLEQVDFTQAIVDVNQSITVLKDSGITSVDDLAGKKIGAQSGTTGYEWAAENVADAEVLAFDEMTAIFAALEADQIDAIAVDLPVANYYVNTAYTDCEVIEEIPTGEQYGIAISKENPELLAAVNKAIDELRANGTYDKIADNWIR